MNPICSVFYPNLCLCHQESNSILFWSHPSHRRETSFCNNQNLFRLKGAFKMVGYPNAIAVHLTIRFHLPNQTQPNQLEQQLSPNSTFKFLCTQTPNLKQRILCYTCCIHRTNSLLNSCALPSDLRTGFD